MNHDDLNEEGALGLKRPWWQPKTSLIAISAVLILAGFLVPASWVERFGGLFEQPARVQGAFSAEITALERSFEAGAALSAEQRDALRASRSDLQLRRMLRAGPMSGEEVIEAKRQLVEGNAQVDAEPTQASKLAMRHVLVGRLAKAAPRLDAKKLEALLDEFDQRYEAALR